MEEVVEDLCIWDRDCRSEFEPEFENSKFLACKSRKPGMGLCGTMNSVGEMCTWMS